MTLVNHDDLWGAGAVRIRAKAIDPFAGLRGRAYITARSLDKYKVQKIKDALAESVRTEGQANLLQAFMRAHAPAAGARIIAFPSHAVAAANVHAGRVYPLPELTAGE